MYNFMWTAHNLILLNQMFVRWRNWQAQVTEMPYFVLSLWTVKFSKTNKQKFCFSLSYETSFATIFIWRELSGDVLYVIQLHVSIPGILILFQVIVKLIYSESTNQVKMLLTQRKIGRSR